jgi:hypothetical protein
MTDVIASEKTQEKPLRCYFTRNGHICYNLVKFRSIRIAQLRFTGLVLEIDFPMLRRPSRPNSRIFGSCYHEFPRTNYYVLQYHGGVLPSRSDPEPGAIKNIVCSEYLVAIGGDFSSRTHKRFPPIATVN